MSLDKILQVAKELRKTRERATPGKWFGGIVAFSTWYTVNACPKSIHKIETLFEIKDADNQQFIMNAANHAADIAEALEIAVEVLSEIGHAKGRGQEPSVYNMRQISREALERIAKIGAGPESSPHNPLDKATTAAPPSGDES